VASVRHVDSLGRLDVMTVNQRDATPLYLQLAAILREQIQSGRLAKDDPLPSESYLQQEHGVSRVTVRKAVSVLRDEGAVYTIQARGTFVT
jgi:GntR family transcriptional regulator